MPLLRVYSNADLEDKDANQFVERAAELVSFKLSKPINYVVVHLDFLADMSFVGNAQTKGVWATLTSVGFSDKEEIVKLLSEFFYDRFEDVELENIHIILEDVPLGSVAIGGKLLG